MEKNPFRKDFLWGAAIAAFQTEGAYNEDGKGLSVRDVLNSGSDGKASTKTASDHYHHYKEDIRLLSEIGLKAFRFSIAWTRIIPDGDGLINQKGIDHYNDVINELIKFGIEPIVTVLHADLPLSLYEKGGWSNKETIDAYLRYVKVLFENYGDRVKYWITDNENNMTITRPVGSENKNNTCWKDVIIEAHNNMVAQCKAMALCHEMFKDAKIGTVANVHAIYPASNKPEDILAAEDFDQLRHWLTLDLCCKGDYDTWNWSILKKESAIPDIYEGEMEILKQGKPDFIGINCYESMTVTAYPAGMKLIDGYHKKSQSKVGYFASIPNNNLKTTQFGWSIDPMSIRIVLKKLYDRYKLPILITENGLGAKDELINGEIDDDYRIDFLKDYLHQVKIACLEGVNVLGYCVWSAIDVVSNREGFTKRYGLIYIDREEMDSENFSFVRIPKKSYYWYKEVIESNGDKL